MDTPDTEKISSILSDPDSMEKVLSIAKLLGRTMGIQGNQDGADSQEKISETPPLNPLSQLVGLEPIREVLSKQKERMALLTAITPYLKEERREKLKTITGALRALEMISEIGVPK